MHATTNLNDASNEQLTRLRNIVWLWCISEGYEARCGGFVYTESFAGITKKSRINLLQH